MKDSWKPGWRACTIVLAVAVVVLFVVVVVQALMLRSRGWGTPIGSVADWLQAVGTLAAFGALFFAAREWRISQAERRDREADQARLVIVEPFVATAPQTPRRRSFGDSLSAPQEDRDLVVANHSDAPVFDVEVDSGDDGDVTVWEDFSTNAGTPVVRPVLQPGETSKPLTVIGATDTPPHIGHIMFRFTDSHGRRWLRVGSSQPSRLTT